MKSTPPLLPNSSPEVLTPRTSRHGTLRVVWIEAIDAHGLIISGDGGDTLLATHNNGHSCAALADRICSGNPEWAEAQRAYISACGGTVCSKKMVFELTQP